MATTKKPRQSKVDPNETPEKRFTRIATLRTGKAIVAMKGISKLTGNNYKRTKEQETSILAALENAMQEIKDAFAGKTAKTGGFKL